MGAFELPRYGPGCGLARAIEESDGSKPRRPEEWVKVHGDLPRPGTGSDCVVCEIATGDHWVGKLVSHACDDFIEVELLGASNETRWFERDAVKLSTLPAHRWCERKPIGDRQRRGEPATTRPPRVAVVEPVELKAERHRRRTETLRERRRLSFEERKEARAAATLAQSRVVSAIPTERITLFAKEIGATVSLVKVAFRLYRATHNDAEPTDDELLEACARVELYQESKGQGR
jgi:hypothetical protein